MKKIGKIAALGLLATLGVTTMASCGGGNSLAKEVLTRVILTQDGEHVSEDFTVPKTVKHNDETYNVTWTSSDETLISFADNIDTTKFTADVKRPFDENKEVKLTATVEAKGKKASGEFKTTVDVIDVNAALESAVSKVVADNGLSNVTEKTEVTLPTTSNEFKEAITLAYALDKTYKTTTLDGTKLTLDPTAGSEKVALSITATCGSNTVTKVVNVNVSASITYLTVSEALDQPKGTMMYVQGRIKSVVSDKYGNFWIEDEAGKEIEIYGLYKGAIEECYDADNNWLKKGTRYDSWKDAEKLAVGDYVFVYGKRAAYKTTEEIENCLIQPYPYSTVSEVLEAPENTVVTMYATVKSIDNAKYGNITLEDADGKTIPTYGLYKGDVTKHSWDDKANFVTPEGVDKPVKYGDWAKEDQLSVGDVIAIMGPKTVFKEAAQVKNPILLQVLKSAPAAATEFTGVVTAIGFKDVDDNKVMRCYVLVQNANTQAKFVYIEAPVNETNTVDAIKAAINEKFVVGKSVTVKGTANDKSGLNQHVVAWDKLATDVTLGAEGTVPAYTNINDKVGNEADLKALQGVLVEVTGTYDGSNLVVSEGKSIAVYYENGFLATNPLTSLKEKGVYTVKGYLNWFNKPQVSPISADSFTVVDESGVEAALAQCTFNNNIGGNFTYISHDGSSNAGYYENGAALKLNKEGQGVKSPDFTAVNSCVVKLNIKKLNENSQTATTTDVFTIKGYNAAGEVVDTKTLTSIAVGDGNTVTLTGAGIVRVEVIMTGYPASTNAGKYCNVSLTSVKVLAAPAA